MSTFVLKLHIFHLMKFRLNLFNSKFVNLDYRTAVSGIKHEHLQHAPSFKSVQYEVAKIIKDKLLIGHAIKHDLTVRYFFAVFLLVDFFLIGFATFSS